MPIKVTDKRDGITDEEESFIKDAITDALVHALVNHRGFTALAEEVGKKCTSKFSGNWNVIASKSAPGLAPFGQWVYFIDKKLLMACLEDDDEQSGYFAVWKSSS